MFFFGGCECVEGFVRARLIWMAEGCECSIELFVPVGWCRLEGLFDPVVCSDAGCLPFRLCLFGAFVVVFVRLPLRFLRSCEVFVGALRRFYARLCLKSLKDFVHTRGGFGFSGHALRGGFLALVNRFVEFGMRGDIAVSQARITEPGSSEDEVGICHEALHTGRGRHVVPFGCAPCVAPFAFGVWRWSVMPEPRSRGLRSSPIPCPSPSPGERPAHGYGRAWGKGVV